MYADQAVNDFTTETKEEWDFTMTSSEMNKKHFFVGGDFEIFLMSMIYKMKIIVLQSDSKGIILGTDTDKLYSFLGFRDSPARVYPPCHLYLLILSHKYILHKYVQ